MINIPEAGRQAAHTIIDAVFAWGSEESADTNAAAMNLALTRLDEVGAATATMDDSESLSVDASDLVGGVIVAMNWLVEQLADHRNKDKAIVAADLRAFLDE